MNSLSVRGLRISVRVATMLTRLPFDGRADEGLVREDEAPRDGGPFEGRAVVLVSTVRSTRISIEIW
jgi:hypothetical protein